MGKRRRKTRLVRSRRLNWDACCYNDLNTGNGFLITEPADISMDGYKRKSLYGARSVLYGSTYSDEQSFIERYRCECGTLQGRMYEGEICPFCHTTVTSKDINIEFTGWISLGDAKVISPLYYNILKDAIGKSVFPDIVRARQKVDRDGHCSKVTKDDFEEGKKPSSPFAFIGVEEFRERFFEIMDYFIELKEKKNSPKAKTLKKIRRESMNVFTSHIPIYSTFLRPQSATSESFYYTGLDRCINPLFTLSENIKSCLDIERPLILNKIQKRVNDLWEMNFELLNGKDGWIRDQLMGGGLNYSARNVIIPDNTLRDNEVDLSYHTFRVLFKMKIISYLQRMNNCTLAQAKYLWETHHECDPTMLKIMRAIVKKERLCVIINRNPTLNYYSILRMYIRDIKEDDGDYTLSVPMSVLPGLNADFDGDILNIIACQTEEIKHIFKKYDPIERMIISRDTGYLNPYFSITKGEKINLYTFCTIS